MGLRLWWLFLGWLVLVAPAARAADGQGADARPAAGTAVTVGRPPPLQAPQLAKAYQELKRSRALTGAGIGMFFGGSLLAGGGVLTTMAAGFLWDDYFLMGVGFTAAIAGGAAAIIAVPMMAVGGSWSARAPSRAGVPVSRAPLAVMWSGYAVIGAGALAALALPESLWVTVPLGLVMIGTGAVLQGAVSKSTLRRHGSGLAVSLVPAPWVSRAAGAPGASVGGSLILIGRFGVP